MHIPPPLGQSSMLHLRILGPLMLMFLLCDADTSCSSEENPLELEPLEVVAEYNETETVLVNCTSSDEYHDGLKWKIGDEITAEELDKNFILQAVPLSNWSFKAKCLVKLSDTECNKELELGITIYKMPDIVSVSALDPASMVEGMEYSLMCDIMNVAPAKNLIVKWYKGNETVKTEQFNDTTVKPVNVSSLLTVTAERDDNRALYRCSAELHLGPNGPQLIPTVTSLPYSPDVHYKPQIPTCPDHFSGVENGFLLVMLPCQADGNPPPTVEWSYQGEPIRAWEPLNRNHSGIYIAAFKNAYGMISTPVNITIEYPPSFACNDHYKVQEDGKIQTVCEPEGIPPPATTWFKDGEEIATPQRWTKKDSGTYILTATNIHGRAQQELTVNVLYAPVFKERNYSKEVATGENVTLECLAEGNPPPEVRWNYTLAKNVNVSTTGGRQKNISVTGATSTNAGEYICVATNKVGRVTRSVTLMLKGKSSGFPTAVVLPLIILAIILLIVGIIYYNHKKHGQYDFVPDRPIPLNTTEGVYA